jgi:hypothetical protein
MHKIIYKVEYNPVKSTDNVFITTKLLGEEYDCGDGNVRLVVNIEEVWERRSHTILIQYAGGTGSDGKEYASFEEEIFDIYQIYRKIIMG